MEWDRNELTKDQRRELETGMSYFRPFGNDIEAFRDAWETHRDDIRSEFIEQHPGRRPFGEWLFELIPQFGERRIIRENTIEREAWTQWGILHTNTIPPIQEPEHEYLSRHGLLTIDERLALEAADRKRLEGRENE